MTTPEMQETARPACERGQEMTEERRLERNAIRACQEADALRRAGTLTSHQALVCVDFCSAYARFLENVAATQASIAYAVQCRFWKDVAFSWRKVACGIVATQAVQ